MTPRLALVPGEPAGVGPELCIRLLQQPLPAVPVLFADPHTLQRAATALRLPFRALPSDATPAQAGDAPLVALPQAVESVFGQPDPRNAAQVIAALTQAADACLSGNLAGMVTGPTHKATLNAGGIPYTGTTELLAERTGREVVMMLARPDLRVALATTHLPLSQVPAAITAATLTRSLRILHATLRSDFGMTAPRIAVLGLNPHAGEAGHLGREELDVIIPVLEALRGEGMDLRGPLPADTAFLPAQAAQCDAVLAMYHDQGLPVLKAGGFEQAVNITLGLPFPRVAVDHGTALDLAGQGVADPSSLAAAFGQCAQLASQRTMAR